MAETIRFEIKKIAIRTTLVFCTSLF